MNAYAKPAETAATPPSGPLGVLHVVLSRNYGPYFVGNFISASGMWFQTLAQSVLIYRLTESALYLGLVNFAQFIGVILLAPWAGPAVDRFDRRRLLIVAQLAAASLTAVLALLNAVGATSANVVVVLVLAIGLSAGIAAPAMHSLVPALVTRDALPVAVALNSATFNLARAVGPAAGAVIIHKLGLTWAFAVNAASYLALVVGLAFVTPRPRVLPAAPPRLRDSLVLLRRQPRLLGLMAVVAASAITVDPVTTLGPVFAVREYGRSDVVAGALVGVFGAGAVVAALFVAGRAFRTPAGMAARLLALAVGIAGFALAPGIELALPALVLAGAGFLMTNAAATTQIQLEVDDDHRGRIMALWAVAFIGSRPLASLVDGGLAAAFGARAATLAFSLVGFSGAAVFAVLAFRGRNRP